MIEIERLKLVGMSDGHLNYFFLSVLVSFRNKHKLIKRYEAMKVVNGFFFHTAVVELVKGH